MGNVVLKMLTQKRNVESFHMSCQVDNIILLSNGLGDVAEVGVLRNFLSRYRRRVNPNLLFVSVDLSGRNPG